MNAVLFLFLAASTNSVLQCPSGTTHIQEREKESVIGERCVDEQGATHGFEIFYYSNGLPLARMLYKHGVRHGKSEYFQNDGTTWRREEYAEGELVRTWVNPRVLKLSRARLEQLGAKGCAGVGVTSGVAPGDPKDLSIPISEANKRVDGLDVPGEGRARGELFRGLRSGPWSFDYPSGGLRKSVTYDEGELTDSYQEWFVDGSPKVLGTYSSGVKTGIWKIWGKDGVVRSHKYPDE